MLGNCIICSLGEGSDLKPLEAWGMSDVEGTKLNLGKAMDMFWMESKHISLQELPLWMQLEGVSLIQQNASLMGLKSQHHGHKGSRKSYLYITFRTSRYKCDFSLIYSFLTVSYAYVLKMLS